MKEFKLFNFIQNFKFKKKLSINRFFSINKVFLIVIKLKHYQKQLNKDAIES